MVSVKVRRIARVSRCRDVAELPEVLSPFSVILGRRAYLVPCTRYRVPGTIFLHYLKWTTVAEVMSGSLSSASRTPGPTIPSTLMAASASPP